MAKEDPQESKEGFIELKKLLFDLEKKILETKKQIALEDKKSADYLEKMAKLDAIRSKNRDEYQRIKKEIEKIEKESEKRAEKELKTREQILKNIEEENEAIEEAAKIRAKQFKLEQDEVDLIKRRKAFETEIGGLQEKSAALMRNLTGDLKKNAETLQISGNAVGEIVSQSEKLKGLMSSNTEQSEAFERSLNQSVKNASGIDDLSSKILSNMEDMKKKGYELVETAELEKSLKEQAYSLSVNAKKMTYDQWKAQRQILDNQQKELAKLKQINQQMAEKSKRSKETRENIVGWIAAVPGGAFLMNKMGLGDIIKGTKTVKETIKDWGAGLKSFALALPGMAVAGAFSLITTALKMTVGLIFDLDQELADMSKNLAITRKQSEGLYHSLGSMALRLNLVGVNVKELSSTLGFLTDEYGTAIGRLTNATTKSGWLEGITILREKFQLTNEEALNFGKISTLVGVDFNKLAMTGERLNKGLLNSKQVFKALANTPLVMAQGFKNSVTELVKFVGKAKALGIDLKAFQAAMEGSLDIESSLGAQMEAEILTGHSFKNMDAFRDASENMRPDLAYKYMMENLIALDGAGKLRTKTQMDAVGKLYSMDKEQIIQSINSFKEAQKVFGTGKNALQEMSKLQDLNAQQLEARIAKSKTQEEKDFLRRLAGEKEGASMQEKIADKTEKIKIEIQDKLIPTINKMHDMLDKVLNSEALKKVVTMIADTLPKVFDGMIWMAEQMVKAFEKAYDFAKKTIELMKQLGILKEDEKGNISMGDPLGEGSSAAMIAAAGGAGLYALRHPIKTAKFLSKPITAPLKYAKNKMFPGKVPIPTPNVIGPHSALPTEHWDIMADMKSAGRGQIPPYKMMNDPQLPSGWSKSSSGLYMPPETPTKTPTGIFEKTSSFFKNQFSKVSQIVDDTRMFGRRAITKVDDFYKGIRYGSSFEWVGKVGKKLSGFADDAVKLGSKVFPKMGTAVEGIATVAPKMLGNVARVGGAALSKLALPLQVAMSAYDAFGGAQGAGKALGIKQKDLSTRNVASGAAGGLLSGLTMNGLFGLFKGYDAESLTREINEKAKKPLTFTGAINDALFGGITGKASLYARLFSDEKGSAEKTFGKTFDPSKGSLIDQGWNAIFGAPQQQQKQQPVRSSYQKPAIVTDNTGVSMQQKPVISLDTTGLEKKMDKMISAFNNVASQPTYIKIGERTIEALSGEIDFRKNKQAGIPNYSFNR